MSVETIHKLQTGNHKVFNAIYEEGHKRVYFYFLKKTSDENISTELTQQTFIKFWNYRAELSIELSIDQQLFQKARLIYIDWLRAEATRRKYFIGEKSIVESGDQPKLSPLETHQDIEWSLKTLSPRRRKVFELKHIHGYSYKEIARILNITVKTVDNHLLKATHQLKKVFNL